MVNKKTKVIELAFFILTFSLLFAGFVSAENPYCEITTLANCNTLNGDIVMKLSSTTNAHGANNSETLYPQVLCCVNFEEDLSTTCNGKNRLLKLSSSTNAHAESPSYTNYSTDICYEGFYDSDEGNACYAIPSAGVCDENSNEIVYLSSSGNAHIGDSSSSYGVKICCEVKPSKEDCVLSSANWGDSSCTYPGTNVPMTVTGSQYCTQETSVKYEVYEGNTLKDTINGKYNKAFWTAISASSNKNYYFNATTISGIPIKSNTLTVYNKLDVCTSLAIATCEDYDKILQETCTDAAKDMCNANSCNIVSTPEGSKCSWNDDDNKCETVEIVNHCGDGSIETPSEECDGTRTENGLSWSFIDFGKYGTSDQTGSCVRYNSVAFKGGELGCYHPNPENPEQCTINTLNCEPINPGICGDGKINAKGEKCDLTDLNGETCSTLGYTGGILSCTSKCKFNTSQCTKDGDPCIPTGKCIYTQTKDSNGCEDGVLNYELSFSWMSTSPSCPTSTAPAGKCKSGPQSIECPAEIPIPFFDWMTLVATILVIGLVYTGISLANKKKSG